MEGINSECIPTPYNTMQRTRKYEKLVGTNCVYVSKYLTIFSIFSLLHLLNFRNLKVNVLIFQTGIHLARWLLKMPAILLVDSRHSY